MVSQIFVAINKEILQKIIQALINNKNNIEVNFVLTYPDPSPYPFWSNSSNNKTIRPAQNSFKINEEHSLTLHKVIVNVIGSQQGYYMYTPEW